ncbi:MAG: class E sortase [Arachnia sp.]
MSSESDDRSASAEDHVGDQAPSGASRRRGLSPLTILGVLMLAVGVLALGYVGWEYFGTNVISEREAESSIGDLRHTWDTAEPAAQESAEAPDAGRAAWLIRIPALGESYEWPVVAGVETDDLARGVGWYPMTAQPGQIGNFALAGHRVTHGEPFRRLLELDEGAQIIIETQTAIYTYELTLPARQLTVQDTETWVIDPVPGKTDVEPTEALITLTTCEDLFHSPDRSVAFGALVSTQEK